MPRPATACWCCEWSSWAVAGTAQRINSTTETSAHSGILSWNVWSGLRTRTLWRELYPYVFPADRVAAASAQVAQILALTGIDGGAVLDLCCGPGRHSWSSRAAGFAVTGVDRSPFLLERAREKADAAALAVEWVLDDMRRFHRPAAFDLACNLFTSFGYFEHEEDNLRVLRNIWQSLRDGGTLVMDMVGKERVVRQGLNVQRTEFADGVVLIQQPRVNPGLDAHAPRVDGRATRRRIADLPLRASSLLGIRPAGSSVELRLLQRSPLRRSTRLTLRSPTQRAWSQSLCKA